MKKINEAKARNEEKTSLLIEKVQQVSLSHLILQLTALKKLIERNFHQRAEHSVSKVSKVEIPFIVA
jgi:hypothetical protein